ELSQLAVLTGHERLLHHRDLEVEILLGEVEVGRERLGDAPVLVAREDERVRLVDPPHTVVVEDLRLLPLRLVDEAWWFVPSICLEIRRFQLHLASRYQSSRISASKFGGGAPRYAWPDARSDPASA